MKIPKCLICKKRRSVKIDPFGFLPCEVCRKRQKEIAKPKVSIEVTTAEIKEDRKKYADTIVQPFRQGQLAKEFVEAYPDRVKEMVKEKNITQEEVKNAKPVWTEESYYKK